MRKQKPRLLPFPPNRSVGTVYARPPENEWRGGRSWWPRNLGNAQGSVEVPSDVQVRLWASQRALDGDLYRDPSDLRPLRDLDVDMLDSLMVRYPHDFQVPEISRLQGLAELILLDGPITDDGLLGLRSLHDLHGLDIMRASVSDRGVAPLLKHLEKLQYLYLTRTRTADGTLNALAGLQDIRVVGLRGTAITNRGMSNFEGLGNLLELNVAATGLSDDGLRFLADSRSLERLDLSETQVSGSGFERSLPNGLHELFLHKTPVTDKGMAGIRRLSELRVLTLFDTHVADAGLTNLGGLKQLENLSVGSLSDSPAITDAGLGYLHGLTELRHLALYDDDVTPGGLLSLLEDLPNLESVYRGLDWPRSPEAIEEYKRKLRRLPNRAHPVRDSHLMPAPITDNRWHGSWSREEADVPEIGFRAIRSLAIDRLDRLWIGCSGARRHSDDFQPTWLKAGWRPPKNGPIVLERTRALFISEAGTLWSGDDQELWFRDRDDWRQMIAKAEGAFTDVAQGPDGTIWAILDCRRLYQIQDGKWEEHNLDFLEPGDLNAIAVAPDGTVWIASDVGISSLSAGTWRTWRGVADGLPAWWSPRAWEPDEFAPIWAIVVGGDGTVWAGGGGGVVALIDGSPTVFGTECGLPVVVRDLEVGDGGQIYAAGCRRIAEFRQGRWRVAEVPEVLIDRGDSLAAVAVAPGCVWIGTSFGALLRFEER